MPTSPPTSLELAAHRADLAPDVLRPWPFACFGLAAAGVLRSLDGQATPCHKHRTSTYRQGTMDLDNRVIRLCTEGSQAEFDGREDDARRLYGEAWAACTDDYEACIAAHYVARFQDTPEETLRWDEQALARARKVEDSRVESFYPSLYVCLGRSHERCGHDGEAAHFYRLAAELGLVHRPDSSDPSRG